MLAPDAGPRPEAAPCCPRLHEAVELVGRRWSGAILAVLLQAGRPLRFGELDQAIPGLSERMLAERLKQFEERGLVVRTVHEGGRVDYRATAMAQDLAPALAALGDWGRRWLPEPSPDRPAPPAGR